jgi:hypothetical protein
MRVWYKIADLWPVFLVAVGVAFGWTLVGSVFDHVHQVDAEELGARSYAAAPGPGGTQVLTLPAWGVSLTLPLALEMPTLSYAPQSDVSAGLSTADLAQLGPACRPERNGLGALLRMPAGTYSATTQGQGQYSYIGTIGGYDYAYDAPIGNCSGTEAGNAITVREESILSGSLSSLSATH